MAVAVLIPAYNPDARLTRFVEELRAAGEYHGIIVVDDGSRPECRPLFALLAAMPGVTVLHHAVNLGKGAALKTGLNYFLWAMPECQGVVTADADGQHLAADVACVAGQLSESPYSLVLGCRQFTGTVPWRSRLGNLATRYAFWALVGRRLQDTQSGLRGIPRPLAADLLRSKDSGYEFELDMLIRCRQASFPIVECPIATVYLEGNRSSHFNPIRDSLRIYCVLLRFVTASLLTAALDYFVFVLAYAAGAKILLAQSVARAAGGTLNYLLARRAVFRSRDPVRGTLPKFALLVVVLGFISYALIQAAIRAFGCHVIVAKVASELIVYVANFLIQRDLVFRNPPQPEWSPGLAREDGTRAASRQAA